MALGAAFGQKAKGGEVVALIGDLGTGKTQFVQGLAAGLDIDSTTVNSPTFTLVQTYEGRLSLIHMDLYRLENQTEVEILGLEEYLEGEGVAAVEWADRGSTVLPRGRLVITILDLEADVREIKIEATDQPHQIWLDQVLTTGLDRDL